jgi:hypothetical protein
MPATLYRLAISPEGKISIPFISDGLIDLVGISPRYAISSPYQLLDLIGVVAQISQSPQGFQQLGSRKNGIFMRIYSLKPLVHKDLIMQQSRSDLS